MSRSNGKHSHNRIIGGFVALPYEMIDHPAFRELTEAALRVLIFSVRKTNRKSTDKYSVIFKFSYPEAKNRLTLSDSTFRRAMKQLHSLGFIDYYSPGGLRNEQKEAKEYQLSLRWKAWQTDNFELHHENYYKSIQGSGDDREPRLIKKTQNALISSVLEAG